MADALLTRASLLARLGDPEDRAAWQQFVELYGGLVYRFARKRRLQDADAADVTQEVLRAVARASKRLNYDPRRGSFRGWLYTVTRNKLYNFLDGRKRRVTPSGDSREQQRLDEQPAPGDDPSALWDREYERRVFAYAAEQVRGEFQEATWRAFWLTAVEGKSAREAGAATGMSPGAVYVAKSRVLARLRQQVRRLQDE
jgi:RNA polymerase sigma-70 factor (ECF subfamily)